MAYGTTISTAPAKARGQGARAYIASVAVLLCVAAAFVSLRTTTTAPYAANKLTDASITQMATDWQPQIQEIAKAAADVGKLRAELAVSLPESQKTDKGNCLNKKLAKLIKDVSTTTSTNREDVGTDFKDENTGKDDYANARNKAALKDTSYMPVATAKATVAILASFMHAEEVVEASAWLEEMGYEDVDASKHSKKEVRLIKLLSPTDSAVAAAKKLVESVKEDFPDLVKHCFITDCPPGKGLYKTSGGPKCTSCVVGETFSAETDDQECTAVLAGCSAGEGYHKSTSKDADATCVACPSGTFKSADDNTACIDHSVTSCSPGHFLTPGGAATDGSCTSCPADSWSPGGGKTMCSPHSVQSCPAGQEESPGTATSNTGCQSCAAGKFSSGGGAACAPHRSPGCSAGYHAVLGTSTSDFRCQACAAGTYTYAELMRNDATRTTCLTQSVHGCPVKHYYNNGGTTHASSCTPCPAGTFSFGQTPGHKRSSCAVFPAWFTLLGGRSGSFCADEGGSIKCNRGGIGAWERFQSVGGYTGATGAPAYGIKGGRHGLWCADESSTIRCNRGSIGGWERFEIEDLGGDKIALRGGHSGGFCADVMAGWMGPNVMCNRGAIGGWERFHIRDYHGNAL